MPNYKLIIKRYFKSIYNIFLFTNEKNNKEKNICNDPEFKFSDVADDYLDSRLKEKVFWKINETTCVPREDLYKIWSKIPGADKWHNYFPIYEKLFSEFKKRPIKVLEIGVYNGASLKMWKSYFHKDSVIVGVDINADCKKFEQIVNNIHIRIGDQSNQEFLDSVVTEFGEFDIIIDDGSHVVSHMIASFNYLYLKGLKNSGIYLVEDIHSNYWEIYRDQNFSFVDFSKHLIDLIHFPYTISKDVETFRLGSEKRIKSFLVPQITVLIDEIRFYDSIIVFMKSNNKQLPVSEHL